MGKKYLKITAEDFELAKTDDEVFNKIYMANEALVNHCFGKCLNMNVPRDELYNSLVDGLIDAINKYEPSKNVAFGNFAILCMMNRAKMLLRRCKRTKDPLFARESVSLEAGLNEEEDGFQVKIDKAVSDGSFEEYSEDERSEKIDTNRLLSFISGINLEITRLYFAGNSQYVVADIVGLERSTISKKLSRSIMCLRQLSNTSLNVHSYIQRGLSLEEVAQLTNLESIYDVKYYNEVYGYLYDNANNLDRLAKYGEFTNNAVPNIPDGDNFELNKKC